MLNADSTTQKAGFEDDAAVSAAPGGAWLTLVHGPEAERIGESVALMPGETVLVGRDVRQGFELHDVRVSRAHLRVVWSPALGGHICADLSSANGTFLNGAPVSGGALAPGDVLRIGDSLLVFERAHGAGWTEERKRRAARSGLPVLIQGETGTGKELLARSLYAATERSGPFVPVNCSTLPRELVATELFGHTRSAFSGASAPRVGLFRAAHGGVLFLDELADLPLDLQPALLRALQERRVRPVGADNEVDVELQVVAATNADIEAAVKNGRFREDLLARLRHITFVVPPLRTRRSEILMLARQFAPGLSLSANAAEALLLWEWPRNVRELRAVMESLAAVDCETGFVRARDLAAYLPHSVRALQNRTGHSVPAPVRSNQRERLADLLNQHGGNVARVARDLDKPRSQVYRWMRSFGLTADRFRP